MELLQSYDQYRELTRPFAGRRDVLSNVFFLPGPLKEAIADRRLLVQPEEDALFIFQREDAFHRLYVYVTEEAARRCRPSCPGPMVVELPFAAPMNASTRALESILLQWGFHLGRESGRMAASSQDVCRNTLTSAAIEEARPEDSDTVYDLLYDTFDPLYAFLPNRETLQRNIQDGLVLVYRKDGRILGVLRMERGRNYASISQFLIVKGNRNLGLGRIFLEDFHGRCQDKPRFWHWVDLQNESAIRLYEKEGYAFDGRYANEYVNLTEIEPCERKSLKS